MLVRAEPSSPQSVLTLQYEAKTDAPTVLNLTNHAYFTLDCTNLLDASLQVQADTVLLTDEHQIPVGGSQPVDTTAFDVRAARSLREVLATDEPQLHGAGGLDHSFVLNAGKAAAVLQEPGAIRLTVSTSEPAVQIYTANHLTPPVQAVCLRPSTFRTVPTKSITRRRCSGRVRPFDQQPG